MRFRCILVSLVLVTSCGTKKPLQVTPIDSSTTMGVNGLVYSLPRTVLNIRVDATRRTVIPGPYAGYAQKYLGIPDAPQKRVDEWQIANIELLASVESDPTCLFAAYPGDQVKIDFLQLVKTGLIIPVNGLNTASFTVKNLKAGGGENIWFKDLSAEPFIAPEKATFYTKVQQDSGFVKVPVQKNMIVEKNMEERAKSAADFIFTLRKKRMEYLAFDADHHLDGNGLRVVFDEIKRLEDEYLALFTGKTFTETATHYFTFTPTRAEGETSILFRFNAAKGVLPPTDLSGGPILLQIEAEKLPENLTQLSAKMGVEKEKPILDMVYYRIPVATTIKLNDGKTELLNRRNIVYQYGPIVRMPARYMVKDSGFLEFP